MALQRNLKALGTFGYQTATRRNPVYIQYIPRTLRYARTNLEKYPRFARLRELLGAHVEELAVAEGLPHVAKRPFGVSTHLYGTQRLSREHLLEIAAHGFEAVECSRTRTHVDYHNPAVIADLQQWLAEARLDLSAFTCRPVRRQKTRRPRCSSRAGFRCAC